MQVSSTSAKILVHEVQTAKPKTVQKGHKAAISRVFFAFSGLVIVFMAVCAIVPGFIAPFSPTEMNTAAILQPPGLTYLLGTDYFGRDMFSLIVYGSRDSLLMGLGSVLVGGLAGALIGSSAGYLGGIADSLLMRFIDTLMIIPGILLALTISAALGPSLINIILAVSVATIPGYARVMRSQVISIKGRPYVDAARAVGTSHTAILLRHILPNSLSPLLVMGTIGIGSSILVGSGLSFLGLGLTKEVPDWGGLLSQGRSYLTVAWWIATFPGAAITLLVLSVNLIGDELRNYMDPKKSRT